VINLKEREIELVSGGFGPAGAAVGAAIGAAGYLGHAVASGEGSVGGLLGATATGAATGFIAGPIGSAAEAAVLAGTGSYVAFQGGMASAALE
jgi:class IIb bacteriocin, lactobin A/cerein 7B family